MINTFAFTSWIALAIAIISGVLGTISMKLSHGLQRLKPTVFLIIFYLISFVALTFAMKHIHLSVVYAIWSGAGTVLVASIGIIHFNETVSLRKIAFLMLIVIGVLGIHLSDQFIS
jgi:small multidrug resistance pump